MAPNALIIIRHGHDLKKWIHDEKGFKEQLPDGREIVYSLSALSKEGKNEAKSWKALLPKWTKEELGISDITRVITKDPRPDKATPNPFDTVYPFIEDQKIKDVKLMTKESQVKADGSGLFPDKTSVLVCWDQEGLWSPKVSGGGRTHHPDANSILRYVNEKYEIDNNTIPGPPKKGATAYVYLGKGEMDVYHMDYLHHTISKMF